MQTGRITDAPPSFFKRGPSALTKLITCICLSIIVMLCDLRWNLTQPIKLGLSTVLYPLQLAVIRPIDWLVTSSSYLNAIVEAKASEAQYRLQLNLQSSRSQQVEQLLLENNRLREILDLKQRLLPTGKTAQTLYMAADPYRKKIIIDKGLSNNIIPGSPVIDDHGVLGQVTKVYQWTSEVSLISDSQQVTPVLNTRSGAQYLLYGHRQSSQPTLGLRFIGFHEDIQEGDLLSTSGIDDTYPAGLLVAKVSRVVREPGSSFSEVSCSPIALLHAASHVFVIDSATQPIQKPKKLSAIKP